MHNIYLIQPNYVASPGDTKEYYLPYSVGVLWAYAQKNHVIKQNYNLCDIIFRRELIDDLILRMKNPKVCVFSCYIWNWEYNKKLASSIKKQWPECKIIFGGPQVTDRPWQKLFFHHHPYVDVAINGEGELIFAEILEHIHIGKKLQRVYQQPRITDLSSMPSPYLTGVFDKIIKDNPDIRWHAVLETNRGCPYACTYCDWGSATYSKIKKFTMDRVLAEIEWFGQNQIEYLFIADANFGIFPERDREIAQHLSNVKKQHQGYPKIINANWQKNSTTISVDIAKIMGTRGFTVSAQTMNKSALQAVKRDNMKINDLQALLSYCQSQGVSTYTDMILGLPNETFSSWKTGLLNLLDYGQHDMIIIYFTQLLENAEMMQQIDQYQLKFVSTDNWEAYYEDELNQDPIREKKLIVNSTSTMNLEEMIHSYMYSWMITIFHSMGVTQQIARYLHNSQAMSYREFYDSLELFIKDSSGTIHQEYQRVSLAVREFLTQGNYNYDKSVMKFVPGDTLLWTSLFYFPKNLEQVKFELNHFFESKIRVKFFTNIEQFEQLVKFQFDSILDYYRTYPVSIKVSTDVYNTIYGTNYRQSSLDIKLNMHPYLDNLNIDDFCWTLFVKKRNSLHKLIECHPTTEKTNR